MKTRIRVGGHVARKRGAVLWLVAGILAWIFTATAGEIRSLAETGTDPLPPANYIIVIDGTTATFYTGTWELVAGGHFQAEPPSKQEMRAETLGFVLQVTGHFDQADNAIFLIISDQYDPPHYQAEIQGIRINKALQPLNSDPLL
jgi:hypothetical protein